MPPTSSCFHVAIEAGVAHIVFSRGAEFNTFTPQAWIDLPAIVKDIDRNARARAIVISSTGKHFTAGMDLAVFQRPEGITSAKKDPHLGAEKFRADLAALQDAFTCLEQARMPVLVAVQGGCIGAGVDLISAHLPAAGQADARRLGAPARLHRRAHAGGPRTQARPRQRGVRYP
jgi:enoyl-CoA hydratase